MVFSKDKVLINVFDSNRAIERKSLSKFPNRKWRVSLLKNIDHAVNEAAVLVLANLYFQSCILNVNKIDVVLCFRKLICAFSLTCFRVHMCKILDKSDTCSLNYSNLFRGPLFFGTQCRCRLRVEEFCLVQ